MVAAAVLCLASASPRRRELLAQLGVAHSVLPAHIDEAQLTGEGAEDYVLRLARAKALHVSPRAAPLPVLAADTAVVLDGIIYGKPRDREDALAMLAALSDRTHTVLTAVALATETRVTTALSASSVRLRATSAAERAAYWETGEPGDKAGGYAIQGQGAAFVAGLDGSYSGVMGLPLYETAQLMRAAALPYWHGAAGGPA
jgi:septum formation protein